MTTRTSLSRRLPSFGRKTALAVVVGAGVVLTPLPALASTGTVAPAAAAPTAPIVAPDHAAQVAVNTAMAQLGKPYVWAAAGPNSFDCSGLALYAWKAAGVSLPHSSSMQSRTGVPVARDALKPGDLVFFYSPVSHVGIYIGNNKVVHAPTVGDVVKISDIDALHGYNSARRIG